MRPIWIGLLAAVPLLALAGSQLGRAQGNHPDFLWDPRRLASAGVTPGDLLRLTAFNPDPELEGRVRFTLFAPDGTPVASSDPLPVGPLRTVVFDLSGDDRSLDAFREAGGRVQLSVLVEFPGAVPPTPGRPAEPALVIGGERVDAATGKTDGTIVIKGKKILLN